MRQYLINTLSIPNHDVEIPCHDVEIPCHDMVFMTCGGFTHMNCIRCGGFSDDFRRNFSWSLLGIRKKIK